MRIILNHTLRSIREHIAQPIVITFTVAVVTILFFASLALSDLFYNFQLSNMTRITGETDIAMKGSFFSEEKLLDFEKYDQIEYTDLYLSTPSVLHASEEGGEESSVILIEATDLNTYTSRYKDKLSYYDGIKKGDKISYPGILISKSFADKYDFDIGSNVDIYLGVFQKHEIFTVTYIFEDTGFFANSTVYNILADVSDVGGRSGIYNECYIKLKKGVDRDKFIEELKVHMDNKDLDIEYAVDYDYINALVEDNESLLRIVLSFIVALVVFILFGAYLIVAKNRASEMIVFKAAGAMPIQIFGILISEVILYGVVGSVIGVITGRFLMQIIVMNIIPSFPDAVVYTVGNYVISICLGILISLVSALVPIIRLIKNSVRNLNSSGIKVVRRINPLWLLLPLSVAIASVFLIIFIPSISIYFTILLIISVIAISAFASPYILGIVSRLFSKIKGAAVLASMSIKRNSESSTLSGLLGGIIVFAFIAVSIVNIIIGANVPYKTRFHSDYVIETLTENRNITELKESLDDLFGVEDACLLNYEEFEGNIAGKQKNYTIYSVKSSDDLACCVDLTQKEREDFDNIDNSAIFSYDMINRLNYKVGDVVKIDIGEKAYDLRIVGVDYTETNTDRVVYINEKACDYGFGGSLIFLNTDKNVPNSALYIDIRERAEQNNCYVIKYNDWAYATSVGLSGISDLLKILEIGIVFVGFIGIINMTVAMFLSRKREFEIYRSVGIDGAKYYQTICIESLIISITGSIIGLVFSFTMNLLMPGFASLIDRYIDIPYFPISIPIIIGAVIGVYWLTYSIIGMRYRIKKLYIERNLI